MNKELIDMLPKYKYLFNDTMYVCWIPDGRKIKIVQSTIPEIQNGKLTKADFLEKIKKLYIREGRMFFEEPDTGLIREAPPSKKLIEENTLDFYKNPQSMYADVVKKLDLAKNSKLYKNLMNQNIMKN